MSMLQSSLCYTIIYDDVIRIVPMNTVVKYYTEKRMQRCLSTVHKFFSWSYRSRTAISDIRGSLQNFETCVPSLRTLNRKQLGLGFTSHKTSYAISNESKATVECFGRPWVWSSARRTTHSYLLISVCGTPLCCLVRDQEDLIDLGYISFILVNKRFFFFLQKIGTYDGLYTKYINQPNHYRNILA